MHKKSHRMMVLAAAAMMLPAGAVMADTVTAKLDNVSPRQIVTIHYNGASLGQAYAGSINWTETSASGSTAPTGNFSTYCIDLTQDINIGHSYTYTITGMSGAPDPAPPTYAGPGMGATNVQDLQNLYALEYDGIGNDNDKAAAFQISIWEMLYETDPTYDATAGNFFVTGASSTVTNMVNSEVAAATAPGTTLHYHNLILAMSSSTAQDQLFIGANNPQHVPPAVPTPAAAMAGAPLLGLVALMRKRRRRQLNDIAI